MTTLPPRFPSPRTARSRRARRTRHPRFHALAILSIFPPAIGCSPTEPAAEDHPGAERALSLSGPFPEMVSTSERIPAIRIDVLDADGSPVAESVEIQLSVLRGEGQLTGTTRRITVDGSATFDDLRLSAPGEHVLRVVGEGAPPLDLPELLVRQPVPAVVIRGGHIVTLDGRGDLEGHSVVVEDGIVTALGPDDSVPTPPGAAVIDAAGRWIVAGLIDTHTHPRALSTWPADWTRTSLLYLANGITTIVTMGDFTDELPGIARDVVVRRARGPSLVTGKFARGPSDGGSVSTVVADPMAARALVVKAKGDGYDFIKAYHGLSSEVFDALVREAALHGMPVLGHVVLSVGWRAGATAGHRMPVHAPTLLLRGTGTVSPGAPAIADLARSVATADVVVGSTLLAAQQSVAWSRIVLDGGDPWGHARTRPGTEYLTPSALAVWENMLRARPEVVAPVDRSALIESTRAFVRELLLAGVPVLVGSDDVGIPGIVPGFGFHEEIREMLAAGVDPTAVLRGATLDPGRFLGESIDGSPSIGTIRAGARADLLLLDGDPRRDMTLLSRPAGVMADGRWYDGDTLRSELEALRSPAGR